MFKKACRFKLTTGLVLICFVLLQYMPGLAEQHEIPSSKISVYLPKDGDRAGQALTTMFNSVPAGGYIYAAIYSLTEPLIVKTLANAAHRGVQVYIITDRGQSQSNKQSSAISTLRMAGAAVKMNTHPGLMHMKAALINDWYLATGSMNWSWAGVDGKNEENFLIIPTSVDQQLYMAHKNHFETMWNDHANYE